MSKVFGPHTDTIGNEATFWSGRRSLCCCSRRIWSTRRIRCLPPSDSLIVMCRDSSAAVDGLENISPLACPVKVDKSKKKPTHAQTQSGDVTCTTLSPMRQPPILPHPATFIVLLPFWRTADLLSSSPFPPKSVRRYNEPWNKCSIELITDWSAGKKVQDCSTNSCLANNKQW